MNFRELSKKEFDEQWAQKAFALVDVREEYEHEDHNLGGKNIPMGQVLNHINELNQENSICFYCQSGKRSKTAIFHLTAHLPQVQMFSLKGGIKAYRES